MSGKIPPEDHLRGNFYSLMARLLAGPPDEPLLDVLRSIPGDTAQEGQMGRAWEALRYAALETGPDAEIAEYERIFYGITGRTIKPYASWYRTGSLAGLPLAEIRSDLNRMGFQRAPGTAEPEDHIAALCETMSMLCRHPLYAFEQDSFFYRHLEPWSASFFLDLTDIAETRFYKAAGNIGHIFFRIEQQFLALQPEPSGPDFRAVQTTL